MDSSLLCENQTQTRVQANSPLLFESDDEIIDKEDAANDSNKENINKNIEINVEPTKEEKILKGLQTVLLGIPPPPAFTVPQLDSREILKMWRENQRFRVTLSPNKSIQDLTKILEEKAKTTEWPEVLGVDHWDVYYNRGTTSEEVERLSIRYKERYVGAETSSCINALFVKSPVRTASARKRARHRAWGHSPGRRLSHLARRRKAFSSANLCSVAGNKNPDKKMIMVEIKKISSRQKKKNSAKKTKPTPNKKKPLQVNTYKRALFQSPDQLPMAKESQTPSTQCIQRSKRNLFAESSGEKKINENGKRERPITKRVSPRKRVNRSLSFQDSGQSADLKAEPLPPVQSSQTSLTGAHKQKMLWAVTNALREESMGMNHDLFRPCMSVLFKTCQKLWLTKVLKNGQDGSTSERMLALAKQFSSYTIKEISADPTSEHMVLVCNNIMRMAESTLNQSNIESNCINQSLCSSGQAISNVSKESLSDGVNIDHLNAKIIKNRSHEKHETYFPPQAVIKNNGPDGSLCSEITVVKYKNKKVDPQFRISQDETCSKDNLFNIPVISGTSNINISIEESPAKIHQKLILQSNSEFLLESSKENKIDKENAAKSNSQCRGSPLKNASCHTPRRSCVLERGGQSSTKINGQLRDQLKIARCVTRSLSGDFEDCTSRVIVPNKQSSLVVGVELKDSISKSYNFNTMTVPDVKDENNAVSADRLTMSCTHNSRIKPSGPVSPITSAQRTPLNLKNKPISECFVTLDVLPLQHFSNNTYDSQNHDQPLKPTLRRSSRLISPKSISKNNSPVKSVCLKNSDIKCTIHSSNGIKSCTVAESKSVQSLIQQPSSSEVERVLGTDYETDKENVESLDTAKNIEVVKSCSSQKTLSSVENTPLAQLVPSESTNRTLLLYKLSNSGGEHSDTDRLLPVVVYPEPPKLLPHWEQNDSEEILKSEDTLKSEETLKFLDSPPSLVPHWEQSSCSGTSTSLPESIMTHWQQLTYNANTSDKIMFDFEDTSYEITFPNLDDDSKASSTCAPFSFPHYIDDSKSGFTMDLRSSTD